MSVKSKKSSSKRLGLVIAGVILLLGLLWVAYPLLKPDVPSWENLRYGFDPNLDYEYSLVSIQKTDPQDLIIKVDVSQIYFSMIFNGGGGDFDATRIEQEGSIFKIYLYDNDGLFYDLLVSYNLKGKLSTIPGGQKYTLQIIDEKVKEHPEIIAEKEFDVPVWVY